MNQELKSKNTIMLKKLAIMSVLMFGFGYLLIPLYEKICDVTGLNQVVKADEIDNNVVDSSRTITVEFDSNSRGVGKWQLIPLESKKTAHPGELIHVVYELRNVSESSIKAQAIPSYGPTYVSKYIKKLDCFCFTQQEIGAGETRKLPVLFVIDSSVPNDVHTVTLSFTMFQVEGGKYPRSRT